MSDYDMNDAQRKEMAKALNLSLYDRYTEDEAAIALKVSQTTLSNIINNGVIAFIQVSEDQVEFFGFQLLEYLLDSIVDKKTTTPSTFKNKDRILRFPEVREMTGLSRTTLWRMEKENNFPLRVQLGISSVGWKMSEVQTWIKKRERS